MPEPTAPAVPDLAIERDRAADLTDSQAMDCIAVMLGSRAVWDSPADFLEAIALLVEGTGRPHPGDQSPEVLAMYRRHADALGWGHDGDEGDPDA